MTMCRLASAMNNWYGGARRQPHWLCGFIGNTMRKSTWLVLFFLFSRVQLVDFFCPATLY